tara:strand:- start:13405 stop:13758 length:354 start_codon:yes stop_codon:yes gene_type:complete
MKLLKVLVGFIVNEGLSKTDYVYKYGEESGVLIGFVNYPRFPKTEYDILVEAEYLGRMLMHDLHQGSFMIQTPKEARWFSRRSADIDEVGIDFKISEDKEYEFDRNYIFKEMSTKEE